MDGLLKVSPDGQKAAALRERALEHYALATGGKVESDSIRLTLLYTAAEQYCLAILADDGYKIDTSKPGGHLSLIEYVRGKKVLTEEEINALDEMRAMRNKVDYAGMMVAEDYLKRKARAIEKMISRLAKA
jgi:hypothetical protein